MPKHVDRIAALLGLATEQVPSYCDSIRVSLPAGQAPRNEDIAQALQELSRSSATLTEVAVRARKIAEVRRAANRGNPRRPAPSALHVDRLRMLGKRPTAFTQCRSCGRPAIPGSDMCYTCS